jgi:hypothetical protein
MTVMNLAVGDERCADAYLLKQCQEIKILMDYAMLMRLAMK